MFIGVNRLRLAWGKHSGGANVAASAPIVEHSHHIHTLGQTQATYAGAASASQSQSYWANYNAENASASAGGASAASAYAANPAAYWQQYYAVSAAASATPVVAMSAAATPAYVDQDVAYHISYALVCFRVSFLDVCLLLLSLYCIADSTVFISGHIVRHIQKRHYRL